MEATVCQSACERLPPDPKIEELLPRHHPVLTPRKLGDQEAWRTSLHLCVLRTYGCRFVPHAGLGCWRG
jgi:hypothetical protein